MPADGAEILRRYGKLKAERYNWDTRWENLAPFIAPTRVGIITKFSSGEKLNRGVFDSTANFATEICAQFIAGNIINPARKWFGLRMHQPEFNAIDAVTEWMEECTVRMLKRIADSSFYAEAPEMLIDCVGFGTGSLLAEEMPMGPGVRGGFRGLYFCSDRIGRYVISEGASGLVDTLMREYVMTARAIKQRWGYDPSAERIPQNVQDALDGGNPDKEFTVIHAIYPRQESEKSYSAKAMPFASCWVEKESKAIIKESGYQNFPAAVPRYQKTPGEVYGRGRGDIAYDDIRTLSKAKEMSLKDWALKIQPPIMVADDAVIGSLELTPGAKQGIRSKGRPVRDVIMPYDTGSRPEVSQINEENLRRSIRQIFFVDQILTLLEQPKVESTAYEVQKRIELLYKLMGPVYGRMEWQFLKPTVDIVFDIMLQAREFPPPPDEVAYSNGLIEAEFKNPLSAAQRAQDVEAISLSTQDLAAPGQMFPEMWDIIDPDKTAKFVMDVRGVPAICLRSQEEIDAVRQQRAKQKEMQDNLAATKVTADAIGKVGPGLAALSEARKAG